MPFPITIFSKLRRLGSQGHAQSQLVGLLAAFVLGFAVIAWRRRYWGPARRAYYTLFAMMVLLVVAFLVRWNYLPPVWR